MDIQNYTEDKAHEIADLFHQSVHAIDPAIYPIDQQEAWAPTPPDYKAWSERLSKKQPFLAVEENKVIGFIELDPGGHIDCMYSHPDYQRRGVGQALYDHLLVEAKKAGLNRLYVEASHLARPFFEKQGFHIFKTNQVERNGRILVNFSMELMLD